MSSCFLPNIQQVDESHNWGLNVNAGSNRQKNSMTQSGIEPWFLTFQAYIIPVDHQGNCLPWHYLGIVLDNSSSFGTQFLITLPWTSFNFQLQTASCDVLINPFSKPLSQSFADQSSDASNSPRALELHKKHDNTRPWHSHPKHHINSDSTIDSRLQI